MATQTEVRQDKYSQISVVDLGGGHMRVHCEILSTFLCVIQYVNFALISLHSVPSFMLLTSNIAHLYML